MYGGWQGDSLSVMLEMMEDQKIEKQDIEDFAHKMSKSNRRVKKSSSKPIVSVTNLDHSRTPRLERQSSFTEISSSANQYLKTEVQQAIPEEDTSLSTMFAELHAVKIKAE